MKGRSRGTTGRVVRIKGEGGAGGATLGIFTFFAAGATDFLLPYTFFEQYLLIRSWLCSFALFGSGEDPSPFSESTYHRLWNRNKVLRADCWSGTVLLMQYNGYMQTFVSQNRS